VKEEKRIEFVNLGGHVLGKRETVPLVFLVSLDLWSQDWVWM